jgi:hypothetical protein
MVDFTELVCLCRKFCDELPKMGAVLFAGDYFLYSEADAAVSRCF